MAIGIIIAFLSVFVQLASADEIPVSRFNGEGLAGWESKSFKGTTEYRLVKEEGRTVVKAVSHGSASGLIRKIRFQPSKHRFLRWDWKISHKIKGGDEKSKSGDDYAARVYVIFKGRYFWQMKAINYIWANKLAKGNFVPSTYAADSKMVAVESGNGKAGQWLTEERDLFADYRLMFGSDPPEAGAIAIMTDTDNTGGSAEAWYGDIILSTE
ncbi:MAG: DUF3047 domain-containing protein, partial [Steroidobacteraceae bacterium]|nr:DUF3047 domain-containing protein [Deltaproteobacteria bacterium]